MRGDRLILEVTTAVATVHFEDRPAKMILMTRLVTYVGGFLTIKILT